jgi:hypothetical protein
MWARIRRATSRSVMTAINPQPPVALRAFDDVDLEASLEEGCLVYAQLRRVEQATSQPIPMPDGNDIRGEPDHAAWLRGLRRRA